jgi:hypothetical protein
MALDGMAAVQPLADLDADNVGGEDSRSRRAGKPLAFRQLPRAYRNFTLIMKNFADQPAGKQASACAEWAAAAGALGRRVEAVRVYRLSWDLSERKGDRARLVSRTLVYSCETEA